MKRHGGRASLLHIMCQQGLANAPTGRGRRRVGQCRSPTTLAQAIALAAAVTLAAGLHLRLTAVCSLPLVPPTMVVCAMVAVMQCLPVYRDGRALDDLQGRAARVAATADADQPGPGLAPLHAAAPRAANVCGAPSKHWHWRPFNASSAKAGVFVPLRRRPPAQEYRRRRQAGRPEALPS
jgi:hypothetical protein